MRIRHLISAALAGLILAITPAPAGAQDSSWLHYRDPSGVEFDHPPTWTVDATDGFIVVSDPALTSFIVMYAFTEEAGYTAEQCMHDTLAAFQSTLPNLTVTTAQKVEVAHDEVAATMSYTAPDGEGFAAMVCTLDNLQGVLYIGATPVSLYEQRWPVITAIADTILYADSTSAAGPAPDADITYMTWTDPVEQAFTVDVPQGWAVDGGMHEIGGTKLPAVQLIAPEEAMQINMGMWELIWFLEPTPELTEAGYPPGSTFYDQHSVVIMVAEYMTGGQAAQFMTETFFGPFCEMFTTTATRDLGDGYAADDGSYLNTGETAFTCESSGESIVGYYYVTTRATYHPTLGQVWLFDNVAGYLAVAEHAPTAGAILVRLAQSFDLTPDWVAAQPSPNAQPADSTAWDLDPSADYDPASLQILSEVNQMMHETSLVIIDNMDGYSDYEYDYTYDYGW